MTKKYSILAGVPLAVAAMLAGCADEPQVSFKKDVRPILDANCMECHKEGGTGTETSGLSMESYDSLMAGTKFGPVIVPGDGLTSVFSQVVEGRVDKSIAMPHGGQEMAQVEIDTLRAWVDEGAKNN